jgi:ABC-type transport system involved in multi-copper enzyme maturation permease subunit
MRIPGFLAGWLPVTIKEGRASILSPRLIIIASILALAVLASTYAILPGTGGGGQLPDKIAYGFSYFEDLNISRPAMAVFVATPDGEPVSGAEVLLVNHTGATDAEGMDILETKLTDANGWARFEGLWQRYPNHGLAISLADEPLELLAFVQLGDRPPAPPVENYGQLEFRVLQLGASTDGRVVSLVFMDAQGDPIEGADVYIWEVSGEDIPEGLPWELDPPGGWDPYKNGTTDANGYYLRSEPLVPGEYIFRIAKGELNSTYRYSFFGGPNPFTSGPDAVLGLSGLIFIPLILPIMALVLAYDAVAREKSEGSLDLLLSKPVGRVGVGLGKLAGVFASMALPVVVILLAAAALIWAQTGQAPTNTFLASLTVEALFLLLVYTILFLAISAHVKNLGTALLVSILMYLIFSFFWGLISFLVASLFAPPGSVRWFEIQVLVSIFSPSGIYQQMVVQSLPEVLGGFFGPFGGGIQLLPLSWVLTAASLWAALPLALFLIAMKYRVTEG